MKNTHLIHPDIFSISEPYPALLLDAYGVFWGGNLFGLFPYAKEAMKELVSSGKAVGILSNSTQLSSKEIMKLEKNGLIKDVHYHFMITSGDVTRDLFLQNRLPFKTEKMKYYLFCGDHPKFSSHTAIFQDSPYSETGTLGDADFIYIHIPHIKGEDETNPEKFRKQVQEIAASGLPMVCANPDRVAHEGDPPRPVVRQGSIALLYEEYGRPVFYIGKPFETVYRKAMHSFSSLGIKSPEQVLMVGDTPETDIKGARTFGMKSALITEEGNMADRISRLGFDQVIQNLSHNEFPDYFVKTLGSYDI